MSNRNLETGLEYANTDPSLHYNGAAHSSERWWGAWIWNLQHGDFESADLIRSRNTPLSDECAYGDHDLCHFSWCKCVHHSAGHFAVEHPPLKSLGEAQSEREEMEFA